MNRITKNAKFVKFNAESFSAVLNKQTKMI